jgi:hypothetical protein
VDPTSGIARSRLRAPLPPVQLACVYRARNSRHVAAVAAAFRAAADVEIRLWALDEPAADLAAWTVGSGPGTRFELLNRLLVRGGPAWALVVDDDVRFVRGDAAALVRFARQLPLDICQPAHALGSNVSHAFTRTAPLCAARITSFVEIGPVVAFSPAALRHVLPFPEAGMGWGTEAAWSELQFSAGLRLGIVDAVTIRHVGAVGAQYSSEEAFAQLDRALAAQGIGSLGDIQRTHRKVRAWNVQRA